MANAPDDTHYKMVVKAITDGRLIPFFGAGVNLCGRPPERGWQVDEQEFLPSGAELSEHLAKSFSYPQKDVHDLVRVSQYVSLMNGSGPLYEELRKLFETNYPPTSLHEFFAKLPSSLLAKGYPPRYQLIVTTNYDDVLERSFFNAKQPFDLVFYVADGAHRGKFWHGTFAPAEGQPAEEFWQHWPPSIEPTLIERPNEYRGITLDASRNLRRPVVLKIHGAIDRTAPDRDSYVITEDHYIDYLTRADISNLVPATLVEKLRRSNFLFLGYGLRDWNLRVILQRIWGEQNLTYNSWAVQLRPQQQDEQFWKKRNVDIYDERLENYITRLERHIESLPPQETKA
jgi:hypothetical protein